MTRPRITSPCVADRFADKRTERIAEFSYPGSADARTGNLPGGLIRAWDGPNGPALHVYRVDGVRVTVEGQAPPTLHRVRLETRNFTFEAFGTTEATARAALRACIERHCEQYPDAHPAYLLSLEPDVGEVSAGVCYRDREPL